MASTPKNRLLSTNLDLAKPLSNNLSLALSSKQSSKLRTRKPKQPVLILQKASKILTHSSRRKVTSKMLRLS